MQKRGWLGGLERYLLNTSMSPTHRTFAASLFLFGVVQAQAHPGHGDHDLTWDLGHLSENPVATLVCLALLGLSTWLVARACRSKPQSLRESQAKRGK